MTWRHPKSTKNADFFGGGEVRPVNRKIQNFAAISVDNDSVFLPSFVEIGKAEVTKMMSGMPNKKISNLPFSLGPLQRFLRILQLHSFLIPHCSVKFRSNTSIFREDTHKNLVYSHYNISVKPAITIKQLWQASV